MNRYRWEQIAALGGIAFVVLQVVAQALIQVGGAEPAFDADAAEIMQFFQDRDTRLFGLGDYISTLSVIPFIWFLGALWAALRRAAEEYAWLALAAVALGLLEMAQIVSGGGWTLAVAHIDDGLTPEQAQLLFDQGNLGFANSWVTLAGMLLAVAVISLQAGALPRWNGWLAVITAIGLVIARAFWATSPIVFGPYVVFWLWLITTSIILTRRARMTPAA